MNRFDIHFVTFGNNSLVTFYGADLQYVLKKFYEYYPRGNDHIIGIIEYLPNDKNTAHSVHYTLRNLSLVNGNVICKTVCMYVGGKFYKNITITDSLAKYLSSRKIETDEHEIYLQCNTMDDKYGKCLAITKYAYSSKKGINEKMIELLKKGQIQV